MERQTPLHTIIYHIKHYIRIIYSWVSEFNLNWYFNEFDFKLTKLKNNNQQLETMKIVKHKIYQCKIMHC